MMKLRVTTLLILILLLSACGSSTNEPTTDASSNADTSSDVDTSDTDAGSDSVFPLTITDAVGNEHTFETAPKIGCLWYGCTEAMAEMGIPIHASIISEEDAQTTFYAPAGPPEHLIEDLWNPELWAASEVDVILHRIPVAERNEPLEAAAPIFYLHHPSYGESDESGYEAYLENLRVLATLAGDPSAADESIARFDTVKVNLEALATDETAAQKVAVLFQGEGYTVIGPDNPFCVMMGEVGLGQCVGEGAASYEINAEEFLNLDPDWIVYQSGEGSFADREDPVWGQLTAVKEGRVFDASGNRYYCCSTRGLIHALQDYVSNILPDADIPNPGPQSEFDPSSSPLVEPMAESRADSESTDGEAADDAGAASADVSCEDGFRLFDHELMINDPVCIPVAPARVLPLDIAALEVLLITGQTPVGTGEWILGELPLLLPEYADVLEPLEGVGWPADLEQVARFQPDLILAPEGSVDLELVAEVAPVVIPDPAIWETWQQGMAFWIAVLNQEELYEEMEANYAQRVAELQSALGEPEEKEISVISTSTAGIWLWMPDSATGAILTDVGLSRPEGQSLVGDEALAVYDEKQWVEISEERIDLVDGDAIFYFTFAATDPESAADESAFIETLTEKPLWQSLEAVQAGNDYYVLGHWWRAQTYLMANKVIDDLFIHLTDTEATTPVLSE